MRPTRPGPCTPKRLQSMNLPSFFFPRCPTFPSSTVRRNNSPHRRVCVDVLVLLLVRSVRWCVPRTSVPSITPACTPPIPRYRPRLRLGIVPVRDVKTDTNSLCFDGVGQSTSSPGAYVIVSRGQEIFDCRICV